MELSMRKIWWFCALLAGTLSTSVWAEEEEEPPILKFAIKAYVVDGAKLLQQADFDQVLAPYVGVEKDFSDVQYALEAVEALYAARGYSAVHVLLPEQELEAGTVHFLVIESRFGKVEVSGNKFFSKANALYALPAVREKGVPRAKDIAQQLRLANENPARQLNVVLKAGERDEEVDAKIVVTDSNPKQWVLTLDNSGSKETGVARLGIAFRNASMFNRDHVGQMQMQLSPQYLDRVKVVGGSYKVPLYTLGHSVEVFGGYSNINSLVGGLSNFQGGGLMLSTRYNIPLERIGKFEPRISFGLDWRKFSKIQLTRPTTTVLYNEIVVTPLSVAYSVQGRVGVHDINANISLLGNVPKASKGKPENFAVYDKVNLVNPNPKPAYKVMRFGAGYMTQFGGEWQFRAALDGQASGDKLIQGEQMRLGGADGVRGFSEGSETGERGLRLKLETYTPTWQKGQANTRGVLFVDGGVVHSISANNSVNIAGAGFGLRTGYGDRYNLRIDAGRIMNKGSDPEQRQGDWRIHATLTGTF